MAATNFLSKLSVTNLVLQSDFKRFNLSHPFQPQIPDNSWLGTKFWFEPQPNNVRATVSKFRRLAAAVSFSLPTAKPERVSSDQNVPKWSLKAMKSFAMGAVQATKLNLPNYGTESLLMGILHEGTSPAAQYLRSYGITFTKVYDECVKLRDEYAKLRDPDIPSVFLLPYPEEGVLSEEAQRALDWAVDQKLNSGHGGEITTIHLLLGIWSEAESPGPKILSDLGFDADKAKVLEALISNPTLTDD